jgi:hypothetical protein
MGEVTPALPAPAIVSPAQRLPSKLEDAIAGSLGETEFLFSGSGAS